MEFLEKITSIVPNKAQYNIEKMGYYAFLHFGTNTFTGKEWGDGKASPSIFNPTNLDTDQWCAVIKSAGMKGLILTAKHHDGFCLWHTKTTQYSVENSPFKKDIVAMLAESCKKFDIKLGLYLSPWDRNSELYATPKYNEFYLEQLKELLTNYGEIFTMWFDGACGSYMDGKPSQEYDFESYYALIRKYQPNCAISNCGPDVRWVGNEGGICRESEFNVVPKFAAAVQSIQDKSQTAEGDAPIKGDGITDDDLGSRAVLSQYKDYMWYPAEVDVSIRPGWFYHKSQDKKVRSVNNLLNIYYKSVGGNAMLLLNIPPDKEGRISKFDEKRLQELATRIKSAFALKVEINELNASENAEKYSVSNLLSGGVYSPKESGVTFVTAKFDEKIVDKLVLQEDINFSQRIEKFVISAMIKGKKKELVTSTVVGHNKVALFNPTRCDNLTLEITECRLQPYLEKFEIYEADFMQPPAPMFSKLIKKVHQYFYKQYVKREEKAKAKNKKKAEKA